MWQATTPGTSLFLKARLLLPPVARGKNRGCTLTLPEFAEDFARAAGVEIDIHLGARIELDLSRAASSIAGEGLRPHTAGVRISCEPFPKAPKPLLFADGTALAVAGGHYPG